MQELKKQTDREDLQADINAAIDAIQAVLDRANLAIDKEQLAGAVADLTSRVDDWKSLRIDVFGDLLRYGTFTVIKGDGGKDTEREVCVIFVKFEVKNCCLSIPGLYFVIFLWGSADPAVMTRRQPGPGFEPLKDPSLVATIHRSRRPAFPGITAY